MTGDKRTVQYTRRDFYKIMILRGKHLYHYADKTLEVSGTTLMFFNPDIPYKFEQQAGTITGYFCIFKEAFFSEHIRGSIRDLPMFALGGKPAYVLSKKEDKHINAIFQKME